MRVSRPSGRGNMPWRKHALDLAKAATMLEDFSHGIVEGNPISAFAWLDAKRSHRRIVANWANGWRLQVNFTLKGAVSSYGWTCTPVAKGKAA